MCDIYEMPTLTKRAQAQNKDPCANDIKQKQSKIDCLKRV